MDVIFKMYNTTFIPWIDKKVFHNFIIIIKFLTLLRLDVVYN